MNGLVFFVQQNIIPKKLNVKNVEEEIITSQMMLIMI